MDRMIDQFLVSALWLGTPTALIVYCWRRLWGKNAKGKADEEANEDWSLARESEPKTVPSPCPSCGYDVRATPNRCPECGTPIVDRKRYLEALRTEWPDAPIEPRKPAPDEEPVVIVSTDDSHEADLLRQQFGARGIACGVEVSKPIGPYRGREVFHRVLVYRDDAELARLHMRRFQGVPEEPA